MGDGRTDRTAGRWAIALVTALLLLAPSGAEAARRSGAPVTAAGVGVLRFPLADGWDGGTLRYSPLSEVLVVKFKRGVTDPTTSLSPTLGREQRNVFARVEAVPNERGSMTVRVHVERRGYAARLRRNRRAGAWELTVTLPPPAELEFVSYAEMLPEGNDRDAFIGVEASMNAGEPNCRPLNALRRSSDLWSAWVALRLADCLRQSGEVGSSVGLALDLAGNPDIPPAVAALASLRLEEWALNLHSAMEPSISSTMVSSLPRDVAFELGLRVARTLTFRQRPKEAAAALYATERLGATPLTLTESLQWVRLQLLHQLTAAGSWFEAARLFSAIPLPSLGSPSREGTIRLGTLALARLGLVDPAMRIGSIILRTGGKVVDPELKSALGEALFALGRRDEAAKILTTASAWIVPADGTASFDEDEGRAVAARLLGVWGGAGLTAALRVLRGIEALDPKRLIREVSQAALLADGDCTALDAASPDRVLPGYRAWAAACWLRAGDATAAAASGAQDAYAPEGPSTDELERAVIDHAVTTAAFVERMDARLGHRVVIAQAPAAPAVPAAAEPAADTPESRPRRGR